MTIFPGFVLDFVPGVGVGGVGCRACCCCCCCGGGGTAVVATAFGGDGDGSKVVVAEEGGTAQLRRTSTRSGSESFRRSSADAEAAHCKATTHVCASSSVDTAQKYSLGRLGS